MVDTMISLEDEWEAPKTPMCDADAFLTQSETPDMPIYDAK